MNDHRLVSNSDEIGIAIIGMAGRFPGAANLDQFWKNLSEGVESITPLSDDDLRAAGIPEEILNDPNYVKVAAPIDGAHSFDAEYFNLSSTEVEYIDPQHRLFLETAVEALENAGCDSLRYKGSIGVFGGANLNVHQLLLIREHLRSGGSKGVIRLLDTLDRNVFAILGGDKDYLTTRASYKLNLRGPSIVVQTACSTSLVAVHLACQSLLSGECDIALAGGVSLTSGSYRKSGYLSVEGMTSPDGRCRPFDARANGTVFGDGVGIVVLKRSDRALVDGDRIRAIIRGSAINNDGSGKVGYTAPSVEAQAAVIVEAMTVAGVSPENISYIETHGTGTPLGDPIEVAALTRAFGASTNRRGFCAIGSVKANIGHLNTAAGIAGLIKVVLALENKCVPPSINFEHVNPAIELVNNPFFVVAQPTKWPGVGGPRRAGVSSLGFGGTNAHVVLEEAAPQQSSRSRRSVHVLPLSARTPRALDRVVENLGMHLRDHRDVPIADVAYTLSTGRTFHRYRHAIVCSDREDGLRSIQANDYQQAYRGIQDGGVTTFAFPGQGAQHVNMGRGLYAEEQVFRIAIDTCADLLQPDLNLDIREVLYPKDGREQAGLLAGTGVAQPAIFSVSYALAKLWMSWGVRPNAMIGHSLGELVAGCLAEVFSLEDALAAVAVRARVMQGMPRGAMIAVSVSADELCKHIGPELCIAAFNASDACVVTGPCDAIASLATTLRERGLLATRLDTSHAFHSPMMAPVVEPFVERLREMTLRAPVIRFVSNVTGTWITPQQATDPSYWGKHILSPVRFSEGVTTLLGERPTAILEVGPGRTLTTLAQHDAPKDCEVDFVASLPQSNGTRAEIESMVRASARLWSRGVPIEWQALYQQEQRLKVSLPTYPFERQKYWMVAANQEGDAEALHQIVDEPVKVKSPVSPVSDKMFQMLSWKHVSHRHLQSTAPLQMRRCLVFAGNDVLSNRIFETLRRCAGMISVVTVADQFSALADGRYTLCPGKPDHFELLWSELATAGRTPDIIIYAWSLLPAQLAEADHESALDSAFYGLTYLIQTAGFSDRDTALELTVVVAETYDILGDETISPMAATALGPCLTAPAEYEHIKCRYVDVPRTQVDGSPCFGIAERIVEDLLDHSLGPIVAYRGTRRWLPLMEELSLERDESRAPVRQGGVYVITGGLGEIGLEVAQGFADKAPVKLALVSRSELPPRHEWDEYLRSGSQEKLARIIGKIRTIEEKGTEVMTVRADVGELETIRTAIKSIRERFGDIHGIIHAAGLLDLGLIGEKHRASVDPVLATKIAGARFLDRILQDIDLDFFVLFSSVEAIAGGPGLVGYRAGNAYLDAFARTNASHHAGKIISINWGGWSEIGMAARLRTTLNMGNLENGLSTREGVDALFRVLQVRPRQITVSKSNALYTLAGTPQASPARSRDVADMGGARKRYSRPFLSTPYVAPSSELERVIAEIWADTLHVENIGINDDFFELGGHSLLALQLIPRLQRRFQIKLSVLEFFEANTIAAGAHIIESKLIEELEQAEAT